MEIEIGGVRRRGKKGEDEEKRWRLSIKLSVI